MGSSYRLLSPAQVKMRDAVAESGKRWEMRIPSSTKPSGRAGFWLHQSIPTTGLYVRYMKPLPILTQRLLSNARRVCRLAIRLGRGTLRCTRSATATAYAPSTRGRACSQPSTRRCASRPREIACLGADRIEHPAGKIVLGDRAVGPERLGTSLQAQSSSQRAPPRCSVVRLGSLATRRVSARRTRPSDRLIWTRREKAEKDKPGYLQFLHDLLEVEGSTTEQGRPRIANPHLATRVFR
jgi:hypothetical protein